MLKLLVVVVLLAVVTYALVRIIDRRGVAPMSRKPGSGPQQRPTTRRSPQRPVGPDDDDEFLRDLDKRRREPRDPDWPA